jgi:hypothetical protein
MAADQPPSDDVVHDRPGDSLSADSWVLASGCYSGSRPKEEMSRLSDTCSSVHSWRYQGDALIDFCQVAPMGNPEHAKLTAGLKPYSGVTVKLIIPWPLELTVREEEELSEKFGGDADPTVSETVVVSVMPPLLPATVMVQFPGVTSRATRT